jgi:hypothetical protein
MRHDDAIDIPSPGGGERRGNAPLAVTRTVRAILGDVALRSPVVAHQGDLRRRPREVDVAARVRGSHHVVRAAERLPRDDGNDRHRGLGKRV